MFTCVRTHVRANVLLQECKYICAYARVCADARACMHVRMYAHIHVQGYVRKMYVNVHVRMCEIMCLYVGI